MLVDCGIPAVISINKDYQVYESSVWIFNRNLLWFLLKGWSIRNAFESSKTILKHI